MIYLLLLTVVTVIFYLWFLKPLTFYLKAILAFGTKGVILIYRPFISNTKYMKQRNKIDNDSMAEIKRKLQEKPEAKIIIYGYMFYCLQNVIDPTYIKKILSMEYMNHLGKMKFVFGDQYDKNLVFSEEKQWKNSRRIISNVFHFDSLKSQQPLIRNIIKQQINCLQGKNINLYELSCKITGRVVIQTMIGKQFQNITFGKNTCLEQAVQINQLMIANTMKPQNIIRFLITKLQTPPLFLQSKQQKELYNRFINFKQKGKEYLQKQCKRVSEGLTSNSPFVETYFKQPNPQIYFQEIIQQFLIFLFAGQDTTAYLAQYPQFQEKILQQFKNGDGNIHNLKTLNNFIIQTNRLYGPARNVLIRKVLKQFQIDGYNFSRGSFVTAGIGFIVYSPKHFDNPLQFNPCRWKSISQDTQSFTPFSSGPRNCIGQHLAKIQVRLSLIQILKKYELRRTNVPISLLSIGNVFYGKLYHNLVQFHQIK